MTTPEEIILTFAGLGGVSAGAGALALAVAVRHAAKTVQSMAFQGYVLTASVRLGPQPPKTGTEGKAAPLPADAGQDARSPHANDGWQARQRGPNGQFLPAAVPERLKEAV